MELSRSSRPALTMERFGIIKRAFPSREAALEAAQAAGYGDRVTEYGRPALPAKIGPSAAAKPRSVA